MKWLQDKRAAVLSDWKIGRLTLLQTVQQLHRLGYSVEQAWALAQKT